MINTGKKYYITVLLSMTLFFTFSMMHEFDWLIPASPLTAVSGISSVAFPDMVEEPGSEDEIEHEESYLLTIYTDFKIVKRLKSKIEHVGSQVLSPPPDMV